MIKRYIMYLIRWQLSTPILAPIIAMFKHSPNIFGTGTDWMAASVANLIGGLIFFWVDRFIFSYKILTLGWEVKEKIACVDCGKISRGYRLVKSSNYDRINAKPEFRCEKCSSKKADNLKKKGVKVE
jgi:hypothetical protein